MSKSRNQEARALDSTEGELVEKSHYPDLKQLEDQDLKSLLQLVRERRDKARTEAQRRRREMRGKIAAKGATLSSSDEGNRTKLEVLAAAVRRLNAERSRRERMAAQLSQAELSSKALKMKQDGDNEEGRPTNTRHAHEGMRKVASERRLSLSRPMERGRLRKAAAVAQAKRDAR
jgi:hypothetical protein